MTEAFPLPLSVTKVASKREGGGVAFVGLHGVGIIQKKMHAQSARGKEKRKKRKKSRWRIFKVRHYVINRIALISLSCHDVMYGILRLYANASHSVFKHVM